MSITRDEQTRSNNQRRLVESGIFLAVGFVDSILCRVFLSKGERYTCSPCAGSVACVDEDGIGRCGEEIAWDVRQFRHSFLSSDSESEFNRLTSPKARHIKLRALQISFLWYHSPACLSATLGISRCCTSCDQLLIQNSLIENLHSIYIYFESMLLFVSIGSLTLILWSSRHFLIFLCSWFLTKEWLSQRYVYMVIYELCKTLLYIQKNWMFQHRSSCWSRFRQALDLVSSWIQSFDIICSFFLHNSSDATFVSNAIVGL